MIFVGLGTNLPLANKRSGPQVFHDALAAMESAGLGIVQISPYYRSAPVPISDQNWYVNAVAEIATRLDPVRVLEILHGIEVDFGRVRTIRNAARTLDLDLLAYGQAIRLESAPPPQLPHPRMHLRTFVLKPLQDLAPQWCHPVTGASLSALLNQISGEQRIELLSGG